MQPHPRTRRRLVLPAVSLLIAAALTAIAAPRAMAQVETPPPGARQGDPPVADEPGQSLIIMNDGRRFRGRIKDKDRFELVLEIAGIDTRFKIADVLDVVPLKTFDEYYDELKKSIRPDDYAQRLRFCQWIYSRRRLELAATELEELLDDNPRLEEARELLRVVNAAIELEDKQSEAEREAETGGPEPEPGAQPGGRLSPTMLLSDDDVNLIRVYEIDLDNPPPLLIRRSTIERLLSEHATSDLMPTTPEGKKAYFRRDPVEILTDIFRLQARDLYGEVRVRGEPVSLNKFRLNVHNTWLMNSCATNQCHGGLEAGQFFLFNRQSHTANTVYTNLLILERTKLHGEPMINYDRPERSPLLQLGLPRDRSIYPHPDVDRWQPAFRDQADVKFTRAVDWMRSMYTPRPDYPIVYEPPMVTFDLDHARVEPREIDGQDGSNQPPPTPGEQDKPSR